jgi:hypothetical protein
MIFIRIDIANPSPFNKQKHFVRAIRAAHDNAQATR